MAKTTNIPYDIKFYWHHNINRKFYKNLSNSGLGRAQKDINVDNKLLFLLLFRSKRLSLICCFD